MTFPRLIFADKKPKASSDGFVVNDLKLDLIFPSEITDILLLSPERETLLKRRQMFSLLLKDSSSDEKVSSLIGILTEAQDLYKSMISTLSEKASSYAFAFLFDKISLFCKKAEQMRAFGDLFEKFCDALCELSGRADFKAAEAESAELLPLLANVSGFTLKAAGGTATVSKGSDGGITASLLACARELDVEIKGKNTFAFAMQKSIADAVGTVYPEEFAAAANFMSKYRPLIMGDMFEYAEELKFIEAIVKFTRKAEKSGIPYCFPRLTDKKQILFKNVYDVTLLKKEGTKIVPNDVTFTESEPFFYLTGANGGGKTTYIRAVGNAVLLFLAGAPVFCEDGEASIVSSVLTHFPRDERFEGTGRFLDEKNRVDAILEKEDGNSLVLLNETFSTTGEEKAIEQTGILANRLYKSGSFGLYITHQHDVEENSIPFLGVTVDESDKNRRTYKIEKRRLPPHSLAKDILEKYALDRKSLQSRFGV